MRIFLVALVGVAVLGTAAFLLLGRGRLPGGRMGRLARIGRLWARLSASWLGASIRRLFASKERRARLDEAHRRADAERVAQTMGQMKGAFMKLGQMMSFVTDQIPAEYRVALASLQAAAPPMDFAIVRDVAEHELKKPLERAFARFDEKPLAAASIGQVHRARLPSGEDVVVKIQYPGVADAIRADLANMGMMYRAMALFYPTLEPGPVVEELRGRIMEELDYVNEAKNQRLFHDLYEGHPLVRIPRVIDAYSTPRVITSEYIAGRRFDDVLGLDAEKRKRYAEIIYRFVFGSIIRDRVFNGDPHPGNYLFDDQGRVAFLDFGCVKHFPPEMAKNWQLLVQAHLAGDKSLFRRRAVGLGFFPEGSDLSEELVYDYFAYFYEAIRADREFTFTREYNALSFRQVFAPEGKFAGMQKKMNMPADFVFVNRIQWGVHSILAQLEATANFHRIHREFFFEESPSTELGEIDREYRARRSSPSRSAEASPA